jgi:hypothetical protein
MRGRRPDRYDYGFSILGVVFTYLLLVFAKEQGWTTLLSITALILVSIPVGLAFLWLKLRLQARHRNVR